MMINSIRAHKILDSRANFTLEVFVNQFSGMAPAGASTGIHEVPYVEVDKAINYINKNLAKHFLNEPLDQRKIDAYLRNLREKIGGNGSIAFSFAVYNNLWTHTREVFPFPLGNAIGGGKHSGYMDIQEILLIPLKAKSFPEAIALMSGAYLEIKDYLESKKIRYGMNDEGAHITPLPQEKALELSLDIGKKYGCRVGVDVAACSFWDSKVGKYVFTKSNERYTKEEQIDYILDLIKKYKLIYVEDPLHEEDFEGFSEILKKTKGKTLICGDDLTTTNTERIRKH